MFILPYRKIRKIIILLNVLYFVWIGLFIWGNIPVEFLIIATIIILTLNLVFKFINNKWVKISILLASFFWFLNYQSLTKMFDYIIGLI